MKEKTQIFVLAIILVLIFAIIIFVNLPKEKDNYTFHVDTESPSIIINYTAEDVEFRWYKCFYYGEELTCDEMLKKLEEEN